MIAIAEAYKAGLLKPNQWLRNLFAGTIVAIIALPLAMAFAIASGLKPEQGIYTAIIAGFVVAVFGGSRIQVAGPTGAFVIILANITAKYGISGLQVATLLAGCILIFMGLLRLGNVIKFIPDPVIVGFTSGIGVIIFINECKDFLGLPLHTALDAKFHQKLFAIIKALPNISLTTTALGLLSLLLVLIIPKLTKRIPSPLISMLAVTLIQYIFQFSNVTTIGSIFGGISQQLPSIQFPRIGISHFLELIGPAFTIALLGAIESLLSASAADGMAGTRHHSNQELIGQGLANIITPLFGGFAATGAIARTATNVRNGGNSPLAAIFHCIMLSLVIIFLAPLAAYIPLCTLAAILFVVAYNMSDIPHFMKILRNAPRYDVIVLLITFFLTLFTNLVIAVNIGVIFAMLFFIRRMSQLVKVTSHENSQLGLAPDQLQGLNDTIIYSIEGPFFFAAAEKIEHALAITHTDPRVIIFKLKDVPFMDMTGLETFQEVIEQYHQRGVKIYLCEANERVSHKLIKVGILQYIGDKKIYTSLSEVIDKITLE